MPISNYNFDSFEGASLLEEEGPLIPVEIGIPTVNEEALIRVNRPRPATISGYALIDTGAQTSGIHEPALRSLELQPIDKIVLHTPSGSSIGNIYMARVTFPSLKLKDLPMNRVIGTQLGWKSKSGKQMVMLLGRDILRNFQLVYNGPYNAITLAF